MPKSRDPYAPPPRHRDPSGAVLRFAIIAVLLGLGVWGYTEFANTSGSSLTAEREQATTLADSSLDTGYSATPTPGTVPPAAEPAATPAPATPAPAAPAPQRSAPAPQPEPAEPAPPPSTTIGTP